MSEELVLNNREEAVELLSRATHAKMDLQARLMQLQRQLQNARHRLADALGEWTKGAQISAAELTRQYIAEAQAGRVQHPGASKAAAFVRKNMRGSGNHRDGLPLHYLMSKQIRESGAALPVSVRSMPPAHPSDPRDDAA
jgi:hypothetical protein